MDIKRIIIEFAFNETMKPAILSFYFIEIALNVI